MYAANSFIVGYTHRSSSGLSSATVRLLSGAVAHASSMQKCISYAVALIGAKGRRPCDWRCARGTDSGSHLRRTEPGPSAFTSSFCGISGTAHTEGQTCE